MELCLGYSPSASVTYTSNMCITYYCHNTHEQNKWKRTTNTNITRYFYAFTSHHVRKNTNEQNLVRINIRTRFPIHSAPTKWREATSRSIAKRCTKVVREWFCKLTAVIRLDFAFKWCNFYLTHGTLNLKYWVKRRASISTEYYLVSFRSCCKW
jgi:hypothetical protein